MRVRVKKLLPEVSLLSFSSKQDMLLTADTPDSMFLLKEGILYARRQGPRGETGEESAGLAVVVPVPLKRRVIGWPHGC